MQIRIHSSEAGKLSYTVNYCKEQCGSFAFLTAVKKLTQ